MDACRPRIWRDFSPLKETKQKTSQSCSCMSADVVSRSCRGELIFFFFKGPLLTLGAKIDVFGVRNELNLITL